MKLLIVSLYTQFSSKRERRVAFLLVCRALKGIFPSFFLFLWVSFFQQNNKLHLSVTSKSFSSLYISDIIWNNEYHHSIFTKQFTKWIPTSTVEERIPIPFDSMFIPFFDMIQVSTHIEDKCRLTWISCPYAQMGCKKKVRTS